MHTRTKDVAKIFKALSDANRLKILFFIYKKACQGMAGKFSCRRETCMKDLSKSFNITIPTIYHHVKELVNTGLITTRKEGRWVYCVIHKKTVQNTIDFLNKRLILKG